MKYIVRTSDRNQFRRCRVAWDFGSKIRMNYRTKTPIEPLDFGSAMHEGLEVLYDPLRWHDDRTVVLIEAHAAFMRWMVDWRKRLQERNLWETQKARWDELCVMGIGMLNHYVVWVAEGDYDKNWLPKFVEVEFEIPIPISPKTFERLTSMGKIPEKGELHESHYGYNFCALPIDDEGLYLHIWDFDKYQYVPVYYQGRIDLIVQDLLTGRYWIVDHKTAAQFNSTRWFDMDTQTRSYGWAAKQVLGIDVEGVMFNRLRKKVPEKPTVLQSGELSKNVQQKTTPELYKAEIKKRGLNENEYLEFLSRFEGQVYNERLTCVHGKDAFEVTEQGIVFEAIDMLDDPLIYPNPGMFTCNNCEFYAPCQAMHDGQDPIWVLEHSGAFMYQGRRADVPST